MISIKRFIDRTKKVQADTLVQEDSFTEVAAQLRQILSSGIDARNTLGPDLTTAGFQSTMRQILENLEETSDLAGLAVLANQTLMVFEDNTAQATQHFREQANQMQSMVLMLTDTIAEISSQSDASISRLQSVERQIERASRLDDIRALKESLAACLAEVKEASIHQRNATLATVERLQEHIRKIPQRPILIDAREANEESIEEPKIGACDYVAAFRLQRADQMLTRFGKGTTEQMLAAIGEALKDAQGVHDRLMRWKGPSFIMFVTSSENLVAIRRRLSGVVAKLGQRYVEAGRNSALLAVGVDWVILPRAQYQSVGVVLAEVDSFLTDKGGNEGK